MMSHSLSHATQVLLACPARGASLSLRLLQMLGLCAMGWSGPECVSAV